ncbi:MAG: 3-phenylpropionate/trans-cinnamate dioxygenase ferredoxin reductase component [Mycobacterium sp.]|jgi:3-phenylpropionate/trans-cinnamate dioxygenase ferredoxin reductase subunit|nr:3-phenylpropionate/trans-cinnamate dioxygenase ferredoxin reductase component [Mycobacterium sp.]
MAQPGLIVIGSGPAGVSAAEAFRAHNGDLPVHILTADSDLPYERPPLSKDYLRGGTEDVQLHPARWYDDRSIELISDLHVERVDLQSRTVVAGHIRFDYAAVVLACGAMPAALPVPGGESALQLRSLTDARRLRQAAGDADAAVIIGAGFIGCEAATSLARRGVAVTLVAPQAVPQEKRLGAEAGERLRRLVEDAGVRYVGGVSVEEVHDRAVRLGNGVTIDCDLILAATGVRTCTELAETAGLDMHNSRIVVGADMQTSAPHIYAAGDVALAHNGAARRALAVEHWQDAVDQGAIAGASAARVDAKWDTVPGFWTTIGETTVKYHAWGDGYQRSRLLERDDGFTVWYEADGRAVGVLTCNADDDYELGGRLIEAGKPAPVPMSR